MSPKQLFSIAFKLLIVAFSTNIKPAHHLRGRRFFSPVPVIRKFGLHAPAIPGVRGVVAQMPVAAEVGSGDERDELGSG